MSDKPHIPALKGRGLVGFYRDVVREMKHVSWPTRSETTRLTGVVIGICVLLALALTALSLTLEMALKLVGIGGHS